MDKVLNLLKEKISQRFDKNLEQIYLIKHCFQKENVFMWKL